MVQQGELFPDAGVTITADAERGEPRLWVRRIVLWEKPGVPIRDIRLRRGLNIVWSPDPGAAIAEPGRDSGSGHGAGKTLLCRLLRYCLGETTFSTSAQRSSIGILLPAGLVGAEVMIEGESWAVIRPVGNTRRHIVKRNANLEEIADAKEASTGILPLIDRLTALFPPGIGAFLPSEAESDAWLFALAWLSRDQECRFDHLLDWRHKRADTGSVAVSPTKDQMLVIVRAFLGVIGQEELRIKASRESLAEKRRAFERDLQYNQRRVEQIISELSHLIGQDLDSLDTNELALSALRGDAESRLRDVEQQEVANELERQVEIHRQERDRTLEAKAVSEQEVKTLKALLDVHEHQLRALLGERSNLDAEELKARLGPFCPVCRVSIDQALAEGCDLSHASPDPVSIAEEMRDNARQVDERRNAISHHKALISEEEKRVRSMVRRETELAQAIANIRNAIQKSGQQRRKEWFEVRHLIEKLSDLQSAREQIAIITGSVGSLAIEDEKLSNRQSSLRDEHSDVLSRFSELFSYVCRGLLGNQVAASLTLTGSGLQADVGVGGMAMESLKVIGFDLAALLMGVEGRCALPAFLVHDSPREADLGEAHYYCLFRLIQRLEKVTDQAPFQYIITTTSQPPEDLRQPPFMVCELQGSKIDGRLLRRNLA